MNPAHLKIELREVKHPLDPTMNRGFFEFHMEGDTMKLFQMLSLLINDHPEILVLIEGALKVEDCVVLHGKIPIIRPDETHN